MAYLNHLASVALADVVALEGDASFLLRVSKAVSVSHIIGYWVQVQPLGRLLGAALDGGKPLHAKLWHPLRSPVYHPPEVVSSLQAQLSEAWRQALDVTPDVPEDDWYRIEIEKVLRLFQHAAEHGECVVSALQPPADPERGNRVQLPFEAPFPA